MLNIHDLFLLAVVFSSIVLGVLFPNIFSVMQPLPLYCLIVLFFFSYLPIRMDPFLRNLRGAISRIAFLTLIKLLILPIAVWLGFRLLLPSYASSALLMSAISSGVTAPFIAGLVGANSALVLTLVIVTSFLIPFTVPVLVELLLVRATSLSLGSMVETLAIIIFIPIAAVEIMRRTAPMMVERLDRLRYPVSLVLFAVTNLGIFSQYSESFYQETSLIAMATLVSFLLCFIYFLTGIWVMRSQPLEDQLAGSVIFANINNVLVLVFASKFFGVKEAAVAALYNIPYFGIILLMRFYKNRHLARLV